MMNDKERISLLQAQLSRSERMREVQEEYVSTICRAIYAAAELAAVKLERIKAEAQN